LVLRVDADSDSIAAAQQAIGAMAEAAGLPALTARRAELVVEELSLNAFRHGGATEVRIEATFHEGMLRLRLEDAGIAFDPTAAKLPDASPDRIGGNGLRLIRRVSSAIRYRRLQGGINRLEVEISVAEGGSANS
jgi:anti-sigma regulatory factor (Ser/Thr protein kinase)